MIDNDVMGWLVPLIIAIIGGIAFIVGWLIKNEVDKMSFSKDIEALKQHAKERDEHNTKQHEELYASRNDMREVLTRLTALFESMDKKQDAMDAKLDTLLERRGSPR